MGATGVNFPHLATYFAIRGRNPEQLRSHPAQTAERNSRELLQGTATWRMKSVNNGGILRLGFSASGHCVHLVGVVIFTPLRGCLVLWASKLESLAWYTKCSSLGFRDSLYPSFSMYQQLQLQI
jgi:hypothetical protein